MEDYSKNIPHKEYWVIKLLELTYFIRLSISILWMMNDQSDELND